ncbi:MAG TPA: hypothetical protein VMZ05_05235 [Spirochaetota bacterium]|nr:hypothetical protein [Spirochaetota bacterium]
MKGIADVDAGICGYSVHIEAEADDAFDICGVSVRTECPNIKEVGDTFEIDILDTMKHGYRSKFFSMIQQKTPPLHCGCALGTGIYHAMMVAGGIALPKDITIRLKKG